MTVCPAGAFSFNGLNPESWEKDNDISQQDIYPALKERIRFRRSIRRYRQENVESALLGDILDQMKYVPTGVNYRHLAFTVVSDHQVMEQLRCAVYRKLAQCCKDDPENPKLQKFSPCVDAYFKFGKDVIFRTAPHLILAGTQENAPCKEVDPLIALSYFEMLANTRGIGTVWCGRLMWLLDAMPELKNILALPDHAQMRYAMLFGVPEWQHYRPAQPDPVAIRFVGSSDIEL